MRPRASASGRAAAATTRLLLTCLDAGWRLFEISGPAGLKPSTAQKRVSVGRALGLPATGIEVPAPLRRAPLKRADWISAPVDERDWLTVAEAAQLVGVAHDTIGRWRRRGLLPHTYWVTSTQPLYLRADVMRAARAPRWRNSGIDSRRLLGAIRDETGAGR